MNKDIVKNWGMKIIPSILKNHFQEAVNLIKWNKQLNHMIKMFK